MSSSNVIQFKRNRTQRDIPALATPDSEILADMFTHWAEMARAGKIQGIAYALLSDGHTSTGFQGKAWDRPTLALHEVERLQQNLSKQVQFIEGWRTSKAPDLK